MKVAFVGRQDAMPMRQKQGLLKLMNELHKKDAISEMHHLGLSAADKQFHVMAFRYCGNKLVTVHPSVLPNPNSKEPNEFYKEEGELCTVKNRVKRMTARSNAITASDVLIIASDGKNQAASNIDLSRQFCMGRKHPVVMLDPEGEAKWLIPLT